MEWIFELLGWWSLAIVKFLFLPWVMIFAAEKTFLETVLITTSGASIGVFVISFFGDRLFHYLSERGKRRGMKIFTPGRRRIVRIKQKYGLKGLMMLGGLISVPITTLLATKYYKHESFYRWKVCGGFFVWSVVLSGLAFAIKLIFHGTA